MKGGTVALGAMRGAAKMVGEGQAAGAAVRGLICLVFSTWALCMYLMLSYQFWPMWSKSRRGLGQLPIGQSTFSG